MTRILEFIVAAVIVFVLAVVFGLLLPSHGHVERSIDVSHNIRHVNDMLMNFRRFPEWGALRLMDPRTQFTPEGPDFGVGAKLGFRSAEESIGTGSYEIVSNEPDSKIVWNITNDWKGTNKAYTITLEPQKNGRIVKVTWAYDVDFGNDLIARYSGLYLHGAPDRQIQANLGSLQSQLAVIPNVDYTQTDIFIADVAAQPALVVQTTSPRSLDEVDFATSKAMEEMQAYMKKNGLTAAGPRSVVTVEWGDENYTFDVVQPIDKGTLTIDKKDYTIGPAVPPPATPEPEIAPAEGSAPPPPPPELKPGELDKKGNLIVAGNIRARTTYAGKALVTTWVGSPAGLPLMRLALKAFALSRGYKFNDNVNKYYDQLLTDPATTAQDEQQFKVFLPITDNVAANEPPPQPAAEQVPAAAGGAH
ncbi:SRPBCC family protein [Tahibacter soli]|uniref:Polyketide cyclase/dehydrase/lipid transport protein n=1 Tax=Tahibacter soli TaxID=2983605 RepID=A0A9X3YJ82_9GAMM|nr:SRPBCC family protein [Tahibacter soli]MDC8011858.1 hypothetical protein [Tahibacter soli]